MSGTVSGTKYYLGIGFGLGGHFWRKGGGGWIGISGRIFFWRDLEVRRILLRSCGVGSAVLDVSILGSRTVN